MGHAGVVVESLPSFSLCHVKLCVHVVQPVRQTFLNACVLVTVLSPCVSFALAGTSVPLAAANTLLMQGFIEYTRDALMVTTAAHALSAATAWGSLLLASIPMYAVSMAASASARRSSNAFSAFGGGADGAPTAAAAAAAPPGRAQVRASLLWGAACGGNACRLACAGRHTPRGGGARLAPMGCCCRGGQLLAPAPRPIPLVGGRLDSNDGVGGQQARTPGKCAALIVVLEYASGSRYANLLSSCPFRASCHPKAPFRVFGHLPAAALLRPWQHSTIPPPRSCPTARVANHGR